MTAGIGVESDGGLLMTHITGWPEAWSGRAVRIVSSGAANFILWLVTVPLVTFFLGKGRLPLESLAVMPVLCALTFIFRALGLSFMEVVIAPGFSDEALQTLSTKKNLRVLLAPSVAPVEGGLELKRVSGGLLVQERDDHILTRDMCKVVSKRQPTEAEWQDMMFAWSVAKHVKSNAIVFCKDGTTLGVGAGQMNRVNSTRIAVQHGGEAIKGSAVASDAFFPFRDGVDALADAGATAVIQPGGSIRDEEVVKAADEHGLTMVYTGIRHFRH